MNAVSTLTPPTPRAPLSCLRCRRVVTKLEQHAALEERVLETLRAARPAWADAEGEGAPHVERYRELLRLRQKRRARDRAERLRRRVRRYRRRARLSALGAGRSGGTDAVGRRIPLALGILIAVVALVVRALLAPDEWRRNFTRARGGGGQANEL